MSPLSRRKFLSASAAAAAGAAFLPETLRTAMAATAGLSGSLSDVGHIVILMQENRSFDHLWPVPVKTRRSAPPCLIATVPLAARRWRVSETPPCAELGGAPRLASVVPGAFRPSWQRVPGRISNMPRNGRP